MGLLEDLIGGALGGAQQGNSSPQSSGGMSPVTLALMALMAYRALNSGGASAPQGGANNPLGDLLGSVLGGNARGGASRGGGGGLGDLLGQVLGGGAQRAPAPQQQHRIDAGGSGGSIGDLLGSVLAGGAAGGAAGGGLGSILTGGLDDIIKQMQQSGQGDVADSWISRGQNKPIDPRTLENALGPEKMRSLAEQAGLSEIDFMQGLAQGLPQVVDRMTPEGRVPDRDELSRWL